VSDLGADGSSSRRAELAANLAEVEERIAAAASASGRRRDDVTLVAVSKTWPAADVRLGYELGIRHVGENRDQEAAAKAAAVADLLDLRWHFIGQLQTNKVRSVARYADVVESVDRPKLVRALDSAAAVAGRRLTCLVQVDLDPDAEPGVTKPRGGAHPDDVAALADLVAAHEQLTVAGVMAVAPLDADPAAAFDRLAEVAAALRLGHPDATVVSAGMSHDLEAAVAAGATHVRIGTAVFGRRAALR
jgi:pyridoxal phosphate enzyme (YggS family)